MSASAYALLGYAGWALIHAVLIVTLRSWIYLVQGRQSAQFKPDGSDVSPFHMRLCRAHANIYENLPIFGSIILVAIATGHASITDPLAYYVLAARVAQTVTHLISTSNLAITTRVTFFSVQLGIEAYWVVQLVRASI